MAGDDNERTTKIGVLVNPDRTDGSDEFVARLRELGCAVEVVVPDTPDSLGSAIDDLLAAHIDVLAAVGGDGTQRTAAERLIGTGVPLAIVPAGTVNLLARVLGIDDFDVAAQVATAGTTRTIDLARTGDDVFALNASTGWDASVVGHVDDRFKRFGRVGFAAAGLLEWVRVRPRRVTIRLDDTNWYDGPALTVVVMNVGQRGSASLHLAQNAELDDGRLDVLVLRRHSVAGFMRASWSILRGDEAPRSELMSAQARTVDVEWDTPVAVQRDGDEADMSTTTTYRSLPGALDVLVPPTEPD